MKLELMLMITKIWALCKDGARVLVFCKDESGGDYATDGDYYEVEGVARHIVKKDSIGFADDIDGECRLRVSGTFEYFIPIHQIVSITPLD